MKIAFCGEYNSANFGDGIISMGLSSIVERVCPDAEVEYFDLSGRSKCKNLTPPTPPFEREGDGKSKDNSFAFLKKRIHRNLYARSSSYSKIINIIKIDKQSLEKFYFNSLSTIDVLIIGGGQLLKDNGLAFPMRLLILVKCAEKLGVRVGFFSVGVGNVWSRFGVKLLNKLVSSNSVYWVACRDSESAARLRVLLPNSVSKIHVTVDSALGVDFKKKGRRQNFIGLGIISPLSVRAGGSEKRLSTISSADNFWGELYQKLSSNYEHVILFCNGSEEDKIYLHRLEKRILSTDTKLRPETFVPEKKEDLIEFLSSASSVVAARMHANIVAFALGVPNIALVWDEKIVSFMKYVGREDFCLRGENLSADRIMELLKHDQFSAGIYPDIHRRRIDKDFKRLMNFFESTL